MIVCVKKEKALVNHNFNTVYWGCVRGIFIDILTSLCADIVAHKDTFFFKEVKRQHNLLIRGKKYTISRGLRDFLKNKLFTVCRKQTKKYKDLNFKIEIFENLCYFSQRNNKTHFIAIKSTQQQAVGLAELFESGDTYKQYITFINPGFELFLNLISSPRKSLLYVFKETIYEFDSIFMHESQHVNEDVLLRIYDKTRADEYYEKVLCSSSDYYFNKYLHHPVELAANMQQLAYYLHVLRPCSAIDATRFVRFFTKFKISKFISGFKRTEFNKYHFLFKKNKSHNIRWYRCMFKLLNYKYIKMYGRPVITNVKKFLNTF